MKTHWLLVTTLALALSGCAARVGVGYGYTAYDPYYGDYHYWGDPEPGLYNQWVIETHRPRRDFRRLRPEEQHQYFDWRHSHGPAPAAPQRGAPAGPRR